MLPSRASLHKRPLDNHGREKTASNLGRRVPSREQSPFSSVAHGLLGPAGLPRDVVMRLNTAVVVAEARKELADLLVALGYEMESNTPEQFAAFLRDDAAQWLRLIKITGASAE